MKFLPRVTLKAGKEKSVLRYHPWVFSGAIDNVNEEVKEGEPVWIYTDKGHCLGTGHFQNDSIKVRLFSFKKITPDYDFWKEKFQQAIKLRNSLGLIDNQSTNAFRLIHGEGDGFSGLIVDYYNGTVVLQAHSVGMYLLRNMFADILKELLNEKVTAIYDKSSKTIPFKSDIKAVDEYLYKNSVNEIVCEYDSKFLINIEEGQKTGFFLDQRENRKLLEQYCKNKRVLNTFCYTGGFSVAALKGGAAFVHSVDSSAKAIELTNRNIELNFGVTAAHQSSIEDVMKLLDVIDNQYDVIVLDPPAFAKHHNVLDNALKGYRKINRKAIEKIQAGGILFTFSCSQAVTAYDFRMAVFSAATLANKQVRILHQLTQPADHPVSIYHPEGEYLKGLVLYIE